jgi:hypothetical protein
MSDLRVNTLRTANGVEVYTAKAWVNFNGTGTVAIRASGNVTSITDNGTGNYTVNFTTAMTDANYAVSGFARNAAGASICTVSSTSAGSIQVAGSVRIETGVDTTDLDCEVVSIAIFR